MNPILQLPSWLFVAIFSGATTLILVFGLSLKLKFFPELFISAKDNTSANIMFYLVSTLLTIVLAFMLITIWRDYEDQRQNTGKEACVLGNLYRDSRALNANNETEIQQLIIHYTKEVVEDGWPAMQEERESRRAWTAFNRLYGKVIRISPESKAEEGVFPVMIAHMNDLASFRRLRIIRSQTPVLPPVLEWSIILATLVTVFFTYLIRVQSKRNEYLMVGLVGLMLGIVFSLIILLNNPYRGAARISPFPLENLLKDVYPMSDITKSKIEPTNSM